MAAIKPARKQHRLRVNIPLAVPVDDAALIHRAHELLGKSRNAFCVEAAVEKARHVMTQHASATTSPEAA